MHYTNCCFKVFVWVWSHSSPRSVWMSSVSFLHKYKNMIKFQIPHDCLRAYDNSIHCGLLGYCRSSLNDSIMYVFGNSFLLLHYISTTNLIYDIIQCFITAFINRTGTLIPDRQITRCDNSFLLLYYESPNLILWSHMNNTGLSMAYVSHPRAPKHSQVISQTNSLIEIDFIVVYTCIQILSDRKWLVTNDEWISSKMDFA